MKYTLILLTLMVFFSGCTEEDIKLQQKECQDDGKKFIIKKVFNYRVGDYETRVECR